MVGTCDIAAGRPRNTGRRQHDVTRYKVPYICTEIFEPRIVLEFTDIILGSYEHFRRLFGEIEAVHDSSACLAQGSCCFESEAPVSSRNECDTVSHSKLIEYLRTRLDRRIGFGLKGCLDAQRTYRGRRLCLHFPEDC